MRPSTAGVLVPGTAMIALTFGLARYGYGLLLPEMRADLGMSASAAGLVSSATYASYMVANVLVVQVVIAMGVAGRGRRCCRLLATVGMAYDRRRRQRGRCSLPACSWLALPPDFALPPYADIVDRQVEASRRDWCGRRSAPAPGGGSRSPDRSRSWPAISGGSRGPASSSSRW